MKKLNSYNIFFMFLVFIVLEWKYCLMLVFCSIFFDNLASNGRFFFDTDFVRMGWRLRISLVLEFVFDLYFLFFIFFRIFVVLLDYCYLYCVWDFFYFFISRLYKNIKMLVKKKKLNLLVICILNIFIS